MNKRPPNSTTGRPANWRGESELVIEPPRHRWQTGRSEEPVDQLRSGSRSVTARLAFVILVTLAMLTAWLVVLLHAPVKTPVIAVAVTAYNWPLPPNAWASEDVRGLNGLDGQTIHWHDSSAAWQSKSTGLEDLRNRVRELAPLARRSGSLIIYLSMHGMVDQDGRPCLIPATGNALTTDQWVGLDEVYHEITVHLPEQVQVLLVLDCVDEQVNWSAGVLHTTFVQSVERWMSVSKPKQLFVLTSSSADQQAWSGPELNGSIFGREFRLALAGLADAPLATIAGPGTAGDPTTAALPTQPPGAQGPPSAQQVAEIFGGNADGQVTLTELVAYVTRQVQTWSQSERGELQTPRLFTGDEVKASAAVHMTWGLKRRELNRQIATARSAQLAPISPSSEELAKLWSQLESLRQVQPFAENPHAWTELERKLVWLERLSVSGSAYTELATRQLFPELSSQLDALSVKAQSLAGGANLMARTQLLSNILEVPSSQLELPSLAWLEMLGKVDNTTAQSLRSRMVTLVDGTGQESWTAIGESAAPLLGRQPWNELNFLGLLDKYDRLALWTDRTPVHEAIEMRDRCEQLAVMGDLRGHRWRRPQLNQLDSARRQVEDQLFIGPTTNTETLWAQLRKLVQHADAKDSSDDTAQNLSKLAIQLRDTGLAEAGYLAAWICSPANGMEDLGDWSDEKSATTPQASPMPLLGGNPSGNDPGRRQRLAIDRLLRWIDNLHALGQQLADSTSDGNESSDSSADLRANRLRETCLAVRLDRDLLHELVRDQVQRLLNKKAEERDGLRAAEAILALPFIPSDLRKQLSARRQQWMQESVKAFAPSAAPGLFSRLAALPASQSLPATALPLPGQTAGSTPQAANAGTTTSNNSSATASTTSRTPSSAATGEAEELRGNSRYLDRIRTWPVHPLTALMQLETDPRALLAKSEAGPSQSVSQAESEVIDRINQRLRNHYLNLVTLDGRQLHEWRLRADASWTLNENADTWFQSALAEHVERAALPVCPVRAEHNNIASFRNVALKDQLYWYARRTLADFYGSASRDAAPSAQGTYFESAVNAILLFAQTLPEPELNQESQIKQLRERLTVLGPLARHGYKLSVKNSLPVAGSTDQAFELSVRPMLSGSADAAMERQLPTGQGVALIRAPAGIVPAAQTSIGFPILQSNGRWTVVSRELDPATPHEAVLVFRGHEYRASLFIGQGIVVEYQPQRYDSAEVVLFGDRQRQPSMMFVLDCSWSMGEQIPIEAIDSRTQSRLDLAKTQLLQIVSQIATRPDARLGVRLFGHRLGWSRDVNPATGAALGGTQILPQPKYRGTIPDDLMPSQDVEAIVPLGRFDASMLPNLESNLTDIVPWGQTPLYLSIIESFKDFASDDSDTAKSVVVITDGDNFQFNANRLTSTQAGPLVTKADVLRAWQGNKIPVYILGVGVSTDGATEVAKSLEDLAEKTGGKYYDVTTGNDLLRALSEQLSTAEYSVQRLSSARPTTPESDKPQTAKLNSPIPLNDWPSTPAQYAIQFQTVSQRFEVFGGEALEMFVQPDNQAIVARPYDRDAPRTAMLSRAGSNKRLMARVHRPALQADGVLFSVSLQDPDSHYTARPKETWIEVVPLLSGKGNAAASSAGRTYWFYDTEYQAGKPVPYQQWLASDWPKDSSQAEVRVWAKYDATPAMVSIPLKDVASASADYTAGRPLTGAVGVTLRVNILEGSSAAPWQLQVTEIHDESSQGVGSLSIQFETGENALPQRVTRRFDTEGRLATHTFSFDAATGSLLPKSSLPRIIVRSRDTIQSSSLHISGQQAIRVELLEAQDLLPMTSSFPK